MARFAIRRSRLGEGRSRKLSRRYVRDQYTLKAQIAERTAELAALQAISAGLVDRQPLATMLERALEFVLALLRLDAGNVRLLDATREHLILSAQRGLPEQYLTHTTRSSLGFSPIRSVVETGQPRIISSDWRSYYRNSTLPLEVFPPFESSLTLALTIGARVIGTLSLFGLTPRHFRPHEVSLAQAVAHQIAIVVENTRLFDEREHQIGELAAIGQIGKLVTASYDLDQMLAEIYRVLQDLTGASIFTLRICEPTSGLITNAVFVENGEWLSLDLVGRRMVPGSLSYWILSQREPLLFDDLTEQHEELQRRGITPRPVGLVNPVRSWVGVPLVARDGELIGVLSLQDYRPSRYHSGTIDFLSQVASHISLGVQKVRLFDERERLLAEARSHAAAVERQAHRIELVRRITTLLSTRLDMQEILDLAARELVQLFWADHAGTLIIDRVDEGYIAAEYPLTGIVGMRMDLRENLVLQRINTTRRPVVINDFAHDPLAAQSRELWRSIGIVSLVIVPLVSRDQIFGSISLDSYTGPLNFSDDELELMMTVATSVAAAVENAQLFAAEQEQRRTAETLREMARMLSSSFDPGEVLRMVLNELSQLLSFDTASIMLLDGLFLRMVAFTGWPAHSEPRGLSLLLEGSAAGEVVRRCEPLVYVRGVDEARWILFPVAETVHAWLGVPLVARERVLGVLNIVVRQPADGVGVQSAGPLRTFSERDIEVAGTFANHAALAIENARLYQESVARVEQELEIARRIQANLFPSTLPALPGLSIAARCLPARETGGDFYDLVAMGTRIGIIVGDVSGKSLPAAMLMAAARSTMRSEARNHETPWVVLTETNRWMVDDVPHNNFVALSYALLDVPQRRLALASAGQLSPLLRKANGMLSFLDSPPALPLGINLLTEYSQLEVDLLPGDTLLFYTDGIVEAHNQSRELFGFERLEAVLRRWGHLPPEALIAQVLSEVNAFSAGTPTHDDMTIVVVRLET